MLETFIHWFTVGIGLVIGILSAVAGIWLVVMLFAIIFVVIADYFYDRYHKEEK
ncbi:hypothetical protein P9Z71_11460 [Glaesserella parasuis]|uniref:hypothetical protein n=1 Tax=Glaesserella parasuis TaxID=738 RepID=UPI0012FFE4FA|nr:hypothetical protein [Glaesserella parasuis]MDG6310816.1 hypothetical protein [Glaesserella parasuis]MDP0316696.1 hypothetical protein [Glaesserella parasuis]